MSCARSTLPASAAEDNVDPGEYQLRLLSGKLGDPFREQRSINGYNLRDVRNRIPRKASGWGAQQHVARCVRPAKIARQRNAEHGGDPAAVERFTLDDEDGPPKTGPRAHWIRQVGPPDFALRDYYHSTRRRSLLAEAAMAGSTPGSIASHTRFNASVSASGSWRATYSRTACAYRRLRDVLRRRASRSASAWRSSGIEMAVFILQV